MTGAEANSPVNAVARPVIPAETKAAAKGTTLPSEPTKDEDWEGADIKTEGLSAEEKRARQSGLSRLRKKLTGRDGKSVRIGIISPMDSTNLNVSDEVTQLVSATFAKYGNFEVVKLKYKIAGISLEELRKVLVRAKLDVVTLSVIKPTNIDFFLYDRRKPYEIYAHSEVVPEEAQFRITKENIFDYVNLAMRRTLYQYLQDQGVELPRGESKPVLTAEIPAWIVSPRTFQLMNREMTSRFYAGLSLGGSFSIGDGVGASNLAGIQFGVRAIDDLYVEASFTSSAYNMAALTGKYIFVNRDSAFRTVLGLGFAFQTIEHTIALEQPLTQPGWRWYAGPTAGFIFPVGDLHFKLETQAWIGLGQGAGAIFNVAPGIFLMF